MFKAGLASLALVSLAALGAEARADWQYTRWGMTPEEVVAASRGAVQLGPPPSGKTYPELTGRARGVHTGEGATFDAYFHFDAGFRLKKIALERTAGTACAILHNNLRAELGPPAQTRREGDYLVLDTWRDAASGNLVRYIKVAELPCTITFDQL
jgi:hypothetical protein